MERIRVWKRELGLTAGVAALGALVAFGLSFTVPTRYQSAATVSLAGMSRERVAQLAGEVSSRASLSWKISKLEMYRDEAKRMPLEDVIAGMQRRDLRVITAWPPRPDGSLVVRILFSYPDPVKSEAMVRSFVTAIEDGVRYRGLNGNKHGGRFGRGALRPMPKTSPCWTARPCLVKWRPRDGLIRELGSWLALVLPYSAFFGTGGEQFFGGRSDMESRA